MFTQSQKNELMKIPGFRQFKSTVIKGNGKMKGSGFWSKLWNGVKNTAGNVDQFLRNTQLISKTAGVATALLPLFPAALSAVPITAGITGAAKAIGYGKGCNIVLSPVGTKRKIVGKGTSTVFNVVYPIGRSKIRF